MTQQRGEKKTGDRGEEQEESRESRHEDPRVQSARAAHPERERLGCSELEGGSAHIQSGQSFPNELLHQIHPAKKKRLVLSGRFSREVPRRRSFPTLQFHSHLPLLMTTRCAKLRVVRKVRSATAGRGRQGSLSLDFSLALPLSLNYVAKRSVVSDVSQATSSLPINTSDTHTHRHRPQLDPPTLSGQQTECTWATVHLLW